MTQPKFTPGPWELDRTFNGLVINGHPHAAWQIVSPSEEIGVCVCILPYEDLTDATKQMCAANAKLIAAAPDMYAALEAAEWGGNRGECVCPVCRRMDFETHKADCLLANALKKAGRK